MRVLTSVEKLLVRAVLANASLRTAVNPIARSTRQTVLQRIYLREWIRDQYVPDPVALGSPILTLAVAQPYLEKAPLVTRSWESLRSAALLWGSHRMLFGVFFSQTHQEKEKLWGRLKEVPERRDIFLLSVDLRSIALPVYFDFEAAWARVTGVPGVLAYPQGLPISSIRADASQARFPSKSELRAISSMVTRSLAVSPRLLAGQPPWPTFARGLERRCLRLGLAEYRSFLNPFALARQVTGFPQRVAFVQGELLKASRPPDLFRTLVEVAGVSPFLFASDNETVLVAALSWGNDRPLDSVAFQDRESVSALQRHLRSIVVVEEELGYLKVLVNHRYDRLLPDIAEPSSASSN
jgi:hypothetical protein